MLRQFRHHSLSIKNPIAFWSQAAKDIIWTRTPRTIFRQKTPSEYSWFEDGETNTCFNCVDRHVLEGRGHKTALFYDSPLSSSKKAISYSDLLQKVSNLAALLKEYGVTKGSTVLIYMPMCPEAVFAMLAVARLGAIHSVVFGGFAAKELATRIQDCKPVVILTASVGLEPNKQIPYIPLLQSSLSHCSHKPHTTLVLQRSNFLIAPLNAEAGQRDWESEIERMERRNATVDCVPVPSSHPLYLLYTSGSTGTPKGVVRENGGHAVSLKWSMRNVMGIGQDDVYFAASDIGWVVGHSYSVYGPLLVGAATVIYEGKPVGTPDAGSFWRLIEEYKINVMFTAPTAVRAIKKEDPEGLHVRRYDISSLRSMLVAGERADPDTVAHFQRLLQVPIRDNYWQTELGWTMVATYATPGEETPTRIGSAGKVVAGYDVCVLPLQKDEAGGGGGDSSSSGEDVTEDGHKLGNLVVKLPLPPGCATTLWNNSEGYHKSYLEKFPGYFDLTDAGYIDNDGYVYVMSRTDDVINVAGHRLSTAAIEQVLSSNQQVAEVAVVTIRDQLKGERPVGFIVLKTNSTIPQSQIVKDVVAAVRNQIGAIACFQQVFFVDKLPKTRSGKVLRRTLKSILNGDSYTVPATIDDDSVLQVIEEIVGSFHSSSKL